MKNFNLKRVLTFAVLLAMAVAANASYVISVYKNGGSELVRGTFPDDGDNVSCTFTIPDYSGSPSDYNYWIGNGAWDDKSCEFNLGSSNSGKCSANTSGSDYISSCSSGKFKLFIYKSSGDKNYYPHDVSAIEPSECDIDAKGDAVPAGAVVFFDNSDGIFSGAVYLSVPTESGNGNAETVDQGTYVRSRDSWYQMVNVEGNIWQATITAASEYGRISFWDKDGSASTDVWQNTVVFQVPYNSSKNVVKPTSMKCRNDNRETDYYPHATWSVRQGLVLTTSSNVMKAGDLTPITLKAFAVGVSGSKYKFEYRTIGSSEWSTLVEQTSPEYVLQNSKLPSKSTYYRVTYGSVTSADIKITVQIDCEDGGSAKNILKYDFGTLSELKGDNSRRESEDMAEDYTYQPYPYKINDGYYAIVATPYYCGCGEGSDMSQTVEQCEGTNMWFRDIKDHTIGDKGTSGNYGAMLMINFTHEKSKIAYEHILSDQEKAAFVKGSTLSFSAYFANAAKETSTEPINMKLKIDYKAKGSSEWETKASLDNNVTYADNWKYGSTSIDIDDPDGAYRVVIENNGKAGQGNDALIDDISLDLCVPTFPVEFYDESKDSTYVDYSFEKIDEKQVIRILKQDYGHGSTNCVFLLSVDKSKKTGQAGRYKVLDEMIEKTYGQMDYYVASKSALELLGGKTGSGNLQAFVTLPDNCSDASKLANIKQKLENGDIVPLESSDNMFSTNILSYELECNDILTAELDNTKKVCEESGKLEADLPKINVTFGCIAQNVFYTLKEDGTAIISDKQLESAQVTSGEFSINLNSLSNVVRTVGDHNFTITMYEKATTASADKLCEKTSAAMKLTVVKKPTYTELTTPFEKCDGVAKTVTLTASDAKSYLWQVNKVTTTVNWQDAEGENNKASYKIPENAGNGWQYRVVLGSEYCTDVNTDPMTLQVNQCDKVSLTLTPDKTELCEGDEVRFTLELKNLGTVATSVEVTEEPELAAYTYVGYEPLTEPFANKVWKISNLAKGEKKNLVLIYKANTATANGTEKVYVSKLGDSSEWGGYDRQTDENMKQSATVKAKAQTASPTTEGYNDCGVEGKKALSDLVTSDKSDLHWYSDYQLQEEVTPAEFDMNVPADGKIYYVTNQESGKCVSTAARASVTVKESPVDPVTEDYEGCISKGTFDLSTRVTNYDAKYTYTYYASDGTILNSPIVNITETGSNNYSVMASLGDCESDTKDITVTVKIPVTSITLHEDGMESEEYDLSGVPTVKVALGLETDKLLTVTPSDVNYTVRWFAGDAEFDGQFPRTPYVDIVYKAVVTDDCANTFEAKAGTQVEWPTIFMPYDDGTNKDFVKGVEGGIKLYIYDRSGNTVATSPDGWDGTANGKMAMPDVYYYKAELPDGSTRKGTVEVFKK